MPAIVAIALILLVIGGGAFIAALALTRRERTDVQRRVDLVAAPREGGQVVDTMAQRLTKRWRGADAAVQALFAFGMERRWGIQANALKLLVFAGVSAAVAMIITRVVGLAWWTTVPIVAVAACLPPHIVLMREQHRAERAFLDMFPDAIDTTVRMLRAGLPITAGIRFVGGNTPPPVSTVFGAIADQAQLGVPVEEALETAGRQVGLADFRFFVVAVAMQRTTGGNLAATLESLAEIIRKRRAVRLKAKAASAEIRVSAYVLAAIPVIMGGLLVVLQPSYVAPLLLDPRGQIILGVAVGMLLLGFGTMWQMTRGISEA